MRTSARAVSPFREISQDLGLTDQSPMQSGVLIGCFMRAAQSLHPEPLAAALREYPLQQLRLGESPLPDVVIHSGVLCVDGMSARFSKRRDALARQCHRNTLIGGPVEIPYGCAERRRGVLIRFRSTARHRGSEKLWALRRHMPHAGAAHGLAGYVDAALVNR